MITANIIFCKSYRDYWLKHCLGVAFMTLENVQRSRLNSDTRSQYVIQSCLLFIYNDFILYSLGIKTTVKETCWDI